MAWTTPFTAVVGTPIKASDQNAIRDDLLETAVAKVTTAGDTAYATAANALARLAIGATNAVYQVVAGLPAWVTNPTIASPTITGTVGGTPTFGGLVTMAGAFLAKGNVGSIPAETTNVNTLLGVQFGTNAGANTNQGIFGFYRSSTQLSAFGHYVAGSVAAAGHTNVNTDFCLLMNGGVGATTIWDASGNVYVGGNLSMSGVILGAAGTFTAPGYSFTGDTNTGIYSHAADVLGITAGGATNARFGLNTLTLDAHLLFTDNTYDVGATGATRPRNVYIANALIVAEAAGTAAASGAVRMPNGTSISAKTTGANDWVLLWARNDNVLQLGTSSAVSDVAIHYHTNGTHEWYIANTQRAILNTTGLKPAADNTYDLGTTGLRWRDVWCNRGAFNGSSRALKRDIAPLAPRTALAAVLSTEVVTYRYRPTDADDAGAERLHVGFIAEDAPDLLSPDHATVTPQTTASLALAAITELARRVEALEATAGRR